MPNEIKCEKCNRPGSECVCSACPPDACGCRPGVCPCFHHKAVPVLVILLGLCFLLKAFGAMSAEVTAVIWPILVIIGGFLKLMGGGCKCYYKHC